MKKMQAMFITLLLLLSLTAGICPAYAAETTSTASAYDVYISGNFVPGGTLEAHYTYYDATGCSETENSVEYTWYVFQNKGETVTVVGSEKTYTLPEDGTYAATYETAGELYNFVVSVKTTNENGQGREVFSTVYTPVLTTAKSPKNPVARNAYIAPRNPAGTMVLGDTVVARFRYANGNTEDASEGSHLYTWYVKDSLDSETRAMVQEQSVKNTYEITEAAYGKYIECDIVPVSAEGVSGEAVTACNHYGNLFYGDVATKFGSVNTWFLPFNTTTYPTFSYAHMMADAPTLITAEAGSVLKSKWITAVNDPSTTFDLKEEKIFDGIFFTQKENGTNDSSADSKLTDVEISFSSDGNTWTKADVSALNGFGTYEILLPSSVSARYVKFSAKGCAASSHKVFLADIYPFVRNDITGISAEGLEISSNVISGITNGMTVGALLAKVSATSALSGATITKKVVDASGNTLGSDFELTESNLSDKTLVITGQNGVAANYSLAAIKPFAESSSSNYSSGAAWLFSNKTVTLPATGSEIYLLTTELYAAADNNISLSARMGTSSTSSWLMNMVNFNNGHLYYDKDKDSGYSYETNRYYTVEVALDYKSIDRDSSPNTISVSIWVDGKLVKNYIRSVSAGSLNTAITPYAQAALTTSGVGTVLADNSMARNSAIYKLGDMNTHLTESAELTFSLYNSGTEAETIAPGATYTVKDNAGLFFDSAKTTYLALYTVNNAEKTQRLLTITDSGSITVPAEESGVTYVLKAFSFSDKLRPNGASAEWRSADVAGE